MDGQRTIGKRGRHNPEFKRKMAAMRALAEPALDDGDADAPTALNGEDRAPIDGETPSQDVPPVDAESIVVPNKPSAGVTPDTPSALDFLHSWAWDAGGQVVLVAIPAEGGKTETKTFDPAEVEAARTWIDKHNGTQNLYFTVNRIRGRVTIKPSKADVEALTHLHADLDLKSPARTATRA